MALTIGTNCGFVTTAPTADPGAESAEDADEASWGMSDTSPTGTNQITEIGWWTDDATEAADFDVALYDSTGTGNNAKVRLQLDQGTAKGTDAGWKVADGLTWSVDASTLYWLMAQMDDTATDTKFDRDRTESLGNDWDIGGPNELDDPWINNASNPTVTDETVSIYALTESTNGAAVTGSFAQIL